ncbi:hypothetical protein DIPPA_08060 [Diplonema papillatum]|nr:hypothetical protein DIPPA_08060 [Diplonema papillatum]
MDAARRGHRSGNSTLVCRRAMLKSLADLEEPARRSERFAGLTGMKVCTEKKSHLFTTALDVPQTIDYRPTVGDGAEANDDGRPEAIQKRTTFDVLGVMLTEESATGRGDPAVEADCEAELVLKRAAVLPLQQTRRTYW